MSVTTICPVSAPPAASARRQRDHPPRPRTPRRVPTQLEAAGQRVPAQADHPAVRTAMLAFIRACVGDVDLSGLADETYRGRHEFNFTYVVDVTVRDFSIADIRIIANRDSKYAVRAGAVLQRVVDRQTPNVDAVSGATTTSKCLLKAIENALTSGEIVAVTSE